MSSPIELFRFCPQCGTRLGARPRECRIECQQCGLVYYLSPAIAVAGIVRSSDGRVLLLRRAKEPSRGRLGMPGGFVDHGETAEAALHREAREEAGVELEPPQFLCSQPNQYHFAGVTYSTLDLFFTAAVKPGQQAVARDEVESICWMAPESVNPRELAFPSMRSAWRKFMESRPLPGSRQGEES